MHNLCAIIYVSRRKPYAGQRAYFLPFCLEFCVCGFLVFVIPRLAGVSFPLHTSMLELPRVAPRYGISPFFLSAFHLSCSLEVLEVRFPRTDWQTDGDLKRIRNACTDRHVSTSNSPTHQASTSFSLRGITIPSHGTRWPRYRIGQLFKIERGRKDRSAFSDTSVLQISGLIVWRSTCINFGTDAREVKLSDLNQGPSERGSRTGEYVGIFRALWILKMLVSMRRGHSVGLAHLSELSAMRQRSLPVEEAQPKLRSKDEFLSIIRNREHSIA